MDSEAISISSHHEDFDPTNTSSTPSSSERVAFDFINNLLVFSLNTSSEKNELSRTNNTELTSTSLSNENQLNRQRLNRFMDFFSDKFIKILKEQSFEYGIDTPADELVRECLEQNEAVAKQWLNSLFIKHYNNIEITTGILRVISHFKYHEVYPEAQTMATTALLNNNPEVRECGIRAFENWGNIECLDLLENISCQEEWLNEYLNNVINDLKEEICNNGISC